MKKKHLLSLAAVENWLVSQNLMNKKLQSAFEEIKIVLKESSEDFEERSTLPPPEELQEDPEALALFSDGGCRGNPGPGAYAFVIQNYRGELIAEGVDYEAYTTNNKMELSGPIRGLEEILDFLSSQKKEAQKTRVKVVSDSKYVVDGMKSWVQGWKKRGWKKADQKPPENLELWQKLDQLQALFQAVDWIWVRGHNGHPQNHYCDQKANEAMDDKLS